MQVFKTRPGGFSTIKKQLLFRVIPLLIIVLCFGIYISLINSKDKVPDIFFPLLFIPFAAVVVFFGVYRSMKNQKSLFESYKLTITNNLITREQLNTPSISIYFNEIKEIAKYKNGSLTITGKDTAELIIIPFQIENYPQLERT